MSNNTPSLIGRCRREVRLGMDRLMDRRWRIDTVTGTRMLSEKVAKFQDALQNIPVSYYDLFRFVGRTAFGRADVFYDIGCGTGRVLCFVARKRVTKAIGIELSPIFADKARTNAKNLRARLSPIEVRCGDAVEMDYSDGTVFFFNNPFGPKTLQSVLDQIRQSVGGHRRPMLLMYHHPIHSSVFRSSGWLQYAGTREDLVSKQQMELWTYTG